MNQNTKTFYKTGEIIYVGQKCPICQSWLIPKHFTNYDADAVTEIIGFCEENIQNNFFYCDTCKSRFGVKKR